MTQKIVDLDLAKRGDLVARSQKAQGEEAQRQVRASPTARHEKAIAAAPSWGAVSAESAPVSGSVLEIEQYPVIGRFPNFEGEDAV